MQVSEVMTRRVISVSPDESIDAAIELMWKHHISGVPVADDNGRLVGLVTEGDFLHRPETGTKRRRSRWRDAFLGPGETASSYVHFHGVKVKDVMTNNPLTGHARTIERDISGWRADEGMHTRLARDTDVRWRSAVAPQACQRSHDSNVRLERGAR